MEKFCVSQRDGEEAEKAGRQQLDPEQPHTISIPSCSVQAPLCCAHGPFLRLGLDPQYIGATIHSTGKVLPYHFVGRKASIGVVYMQESFRLKEQWRPRRK